VALAVAGVDLDAPEVLSHLILWADAVALYGLLWFGMAALVATLGKSSASNAMMLVGVWIVCVVLLPSLVSMAATSLYPVPSRVEMIQAMRVASDEANEEGSRLLARYYEDHPELANDDTQQAMNNFSMVRVAVTTEVDRRVQPVLRRYTEQLEAQQRIVAYARFLSPAILMQDILNDVAGTGTWRHREFVRQVETYHQRWRNHFVPLISQKRLLVDYSGLPQFAFEEEDIGVVARRVMISLAWLAIPTVVIAALAFLRLRRFRVDA
jgi:ABC-2 type transport system permease protein